MVDAYDNRFPILHKINQNIHINFTIIPHETKAHLSPYVIAESSKKTFETSKFVV